MITIDQCNEFILKKFGLRLIKQTDSWVEYTDGLKVLFIDKGCFHYYFQSSDSAVPITPDIVILVDLIRDVILNVEPEYDIFKSYKKSQTLLKEAINNEEY